MDIVHGMHFDAQARTTMNVMAQPDANSYVCLFYRNRAPTRSCGPMNWIASCCRKRAPFTSARSA